MKLRNRVIAIVMTVLIMVSSPLQALAQAEASNKGRQYLSEVRVGVGKTADEAAKSLEDEGFTVLKADGKNVDLNQGAGSAFKEDRVVCLGYKTTGETLGAITDLAVMNMKGGYKFSDYRALMDNYRDKQIKPFVDGFLATVKEYRENATSQNEGNRAKAEYIRTMLNNIVEDDSTGKMGDLLLEQTCEEMGKTWESLSTEDRAAHVDLTKALMQGNSDIVFLMEQLITAAADTNENTWLQRLSELGPDGLQASYGDMLAEDARREMAAKYYDAAKTILGGWEDLRTELMNYDAQINAEVGFDEQQLVQQINDAQGEQATGNAAESAATSDSAAPEVVDPNEEDAQATELGENASSAGDPTQPTQDGGSEAVALRTPFLGPRVAYAEENAGAQPQDVAAVDLQDYTQLQLGAEEPKKVDINNPVQVVGSMEESLEASAEVAEDVSQNRIASIYSLLCAMPYGTGSMYDFFTKPVDEVAENDAVALYPLVSTLSPGQIAGLEFLPLQMLLQIGCITGDAYDDLSFEKSNLLEGMGELPNVSVYQGINRELFSDKVALTSAALRADALGNKTFNDPNDDLGGISTRTAVMWGSTVAFGFVTGFSALKYAKTSKVEALQFLNLSTDIINNEKRSLDKVYNANKKLIEQIAQRKYAMSQTVVVSSLEQNAQKQIPEFLRQVKWEIETSEFEDIPSVMNYVKQENVTATIVKHYENGKIIEELQLGINFNNAPKNVHDDVLENFRYMLDLYENKKKDINNPKDFAWLLDHPDWEPLTESDLPNVRDLKIKRVVKIGEADAEELTQLTELQSKFERAKKNVEQKQITCNKSAGKWAVFGTVMGVATIVLTVASIISTAYDLYQYYNVKYTDIPKYIVDEADITATDGEGNTVVVRNDSAYYEVVRTNRAKDSEHYKALQDYADLNGDAGKEWLALYTARQDAQEPILADSLKVVVGSTSVPEGYANSIHEFGNTSAANLTDLRYCYNDKANGVYAYFKRAEPAPVTASAFASGSTALVGGLCLAAGAALGAGGMYLAGKRRREPATA